MYIPVVARPVLSSPFLRCPLPRYLILLCGRIQRSFAVCLMVPHQDHFRQRTPPWEVGELRKFFRIPNFPILHLSR